MAKAAAQYGGIYASHMRGEGKEVVQSVRRGDRDRRARRHAGRDLPSQGRVQAGLGNADGLGAPRHRRGARARASTSPRTCTSTRPAAPDSKRRFRAGRSTAATTRCSRGSPNPETRARLKREQKTGSPGWWNIIEAAGGWDGIVLVNARNPENAKYQQKTIAQIAQETGKDPADAAWDLVAAGTRPRDGDLPHDGRAGHRDGAALSVDEHRQRRRRRAEVAGSGDDLGCRTRAASATSLA